MRLKIIGGGLKGKKLRFLKGRTVRPTLGKLRETIFNIIAPYIQDAFVLDMFAGTGAFGIEALSRGAKFAVFLENDKYALSIIKHNIQSCGFDDRTAIIKWDIIKNLNCIKFPFSLFKQKAFRQKLQEQPNKTIFDLVFMDPPYDKNLIKPALINLHNSKSMTKKALIVVEHSPTESILQDKLNFEFIDQRKKGVTFLYC